jgi:nitroreductase
MILLGVNMTNDYDFNMPLGDAMRTQRAIRRLKPDPVEDALLLDLIELAIKAPSGSNAQGWQFVIVKDQQVKNEFARLNRQAWRFATPFRSMFKRGAPSNNKIAAAVQWQADHFEQIPVLIVTCLTGRYIPFIHLSATSYFGSIYPAVQNLLLAARAVDLGAALITIPLWNVSAVRRLLALPRNITPCALIPLGWPLGHYGPTTRKPIQELVSFDRYGNRPTTR